MQIPGYEILEKLGEGGTATVWKAKQITLERTVALKVLNHALAADAGAAERFRTEGMAAAKLTHQNIVQVFDAGEFKGQPYFAMEFVSGYSLGDLVARKGKMSVEQALAAAESVATALKYAWEKARIIHCDVKPDNILVDTDGTVKVADLGLARILSHREGQAERDVIGTPNYVSPEQAQGGIELDFRSDIYSLGATLYHLVTGVMPFSDLAGAAAMDAHIGEFLNDPIELNISIPPAVATLIEKLMVRNRDDRYASWDEVMDDLDAVLSGRMPMTPLPEAGASTVACSEERRAMTSASKRPVTAKKKVISMSHKPVLKTTKQPSREPDRSDAEHDSDRRAPEPRKSSKLILPVSIAAVVAVIGFWLLVQRDADGLSQIDRWNGKKPVHKSDDDPFLHSLTGPGGTQQGATTIGGMTPYIPPQRTSNELRIIQNSAMFSWTNANYTRATAQYNTALRAWVAYTEGKESANNLKRIKYSLDQAIEYYEKCKPDALAKYGVPEYLSKCSNLMAEVQTAMAAPK